MDRRTARKYIAAGTLPSAMVPSRDWRTRPDPFEEHWPEIEARLRDTPELEAKTLCELLQDQHPGRYEDGQLRTLQRHVKQWRAAHGPEREIVLSSIAPGKRARSTKKASGRSSNGTSGYNATRSFWPTGRARLRERHDFPAGTRAQVVDLQTESELLPSSALIESEWAHSVATAHAKN